MVDTGRDGLEGLRLLKPEEEGTSGEERLSWRI
jgi:hypothetical protein